MMMMMMMMMMMLMMMMLMMLMLLLLLREPTVPSAQHKLQDGKIDFTDGNALKSYNALHDW